MSVSSSLCKGGHVARGVPSSEYLCEFLQNAECDRSKNVQEPGPMMLSNRIYLAEIRVSRQRGFTSSIDLIDLPLKRSYQRM